MKKEVSSLRVVVAALLLISSAFLAVAQQTQSLSPPDKKERQWVSVKGAVRSPMRVELRRRVRLIEVLAMAGGVTERAKGDVQIERVSGTSAENASEKQSTTVITVHLSALKRGETKANPYLLPGDVITVLE